MGFERELHGLLGMFVPGEMIFFSVVHGGGAVGVRGLFVEFRCSLMRVVRHNVFLPQAQSGETYSFGRTSDDSASAPSREYKTRKIKTSARPKLMRRFSDTPTFNMILLIIGIEGSGKTTIGMLLAARLHYQFKDADEFHSAANKEKMRQGIPLTDADRRPWLAAIRDQIGSWIAAQEKRRHHLLRAQTKLSR